jgi:DNA-binding NtrC family response regulator
MSIPRIFDETNYTVLLAADGVDALQVAERYQGPIQLLITDVVMPGLSGPELAAQLSASRPEMKVLYMSGYSPEVLAEHGPIANCEFIQKPFKPQDLKRRVNELLESVTFAMPAKIEDLQLGAERTSRPSAAPGSEGNSG